MVVKKAKVVVFREVVVVVVVVVVLLLGYNRVSLAYQCGGGDGCSGTQLENGDAGAVNAHTHTHRLVRSETVVLPLLVTAAAELNFPALPPLLG